MRAGRVILTVLLLPMVGCTTQPDETTTAKRQISEERARSTDFSGWDRQLCVAVSRDDMEGVHSALGEGANPNTGWGNDGGTVLHHAIAAGYTEIAQLLITHGADLRAHHEAMCDATPLHLAAEFGRYEIAGLLIAHGAEIDARDVDGMTPLHKAAWKGHKAVAELLLAHGANVDASDRGDSTPLHQAVMADYVAVGHAFIEAQYGDGRRDAEKTDAKLEAERKRFQANLKADMVRLLVAHGANVNREDYVGGTPLGYAIMDESVGVVEALLRSGARPDRVNRHDGTTAFHDAAGGGLLEVVKLFLAYGAAVNVKDADKQTPLHEAVWEGNVEMTELLLTHGADVNAKDKRRDTPLHIAAVNRHTQLFDLLVSKGADLKAVNKEGLPPVAYAGSMPRQEMIRLTPDGSCPYSVIITSVGQIRSFLRSRKIPYDQFWIPGKADIERAEAILNRSREPRKTGKTGAASGREPIADDLGRYNREYAGFKRGKAKFVLCNLNNHGPDARPLENRLSSPGFDEWGAFKLAAVALDSERVEWVESVYF